MVYLFLKITQQARQKLCRRCHAHRDKQRLKGRLSFILAPGPHRFTTAARRLGWFHPQWILMMAQMYIKYFNCKACVNIFLNNFILNPFTGFALIALVYHRSDYKITF
jgi:hypothetical protein